MNFTDTLLSAEMVIKTDSVPLIVGESGIGKTALAKSLADKNGYQLIVIDGNLLKEGEIGGLPTIEDYIEINKDGVKIKKRKTVYAIHTKLQEIDNVIASGKKVLLFIDEINRCEHTVQQELMNLILNREINGYSLPNDVSILAAMNPSNKYNNFEETDYQVVDMDPAQENRFVWLEMESEVKSWLQWAIENGLDNKVIEFISTFPEYLHTSNEEETIKATPRSWERISKSYSYYKDNKDSIPSRILFNVLKGNVGTKIAQEFINFIENHNEPLISYDEIFENKEFSKELKDRVKNESHSRLYLTSKNVLYYLENKFDNEREINIFSKFINLYPVDLKIGVMQEIKENYKNLYDKFLDNEDFIEGYFKTYSDVKS
ncbi:MAG: ATP-binding protein [Clostridium argentinense]|uniref:ATP-binding protein n=1 Tax=Clostridium faecium TaxID=2762223 RepID=A0ABR8YP36_9CLOT|nr:MULTISPECIES: ATP-binding protein [Clostridium]MBD8045995.1 ATP-binding protein [Clostridium faecium]MBS5824486.1 ATP-binding protein [Clostridium argentinense]MDU1349545.1 ATP-binding protein [Clostridium argentinense]